MLPILSSKDISAWDQVTIANEPIESKQLMFRAASRCASWIMDNFSDKNTTFHVFAGIGNNGGDALVIADVLNSNGYKTEVSIVNFSDQHSGDFNHYYDKLVKTKITIRDIHISSNFPEIVRDAIIIDGIFGIGLNRPAEGVARECIEFINSLDAVVLSIDAPSGLSVDLNLMHQAQASVVNASHTLTFQVPKLGLILPDFGNCVGKLSLIDIGLDPNFISEFESNLFWIDSNYSYKDLFRRLKFSHKGTFGKVTIVAGQYGSMGASVLATKAAVYSGAGLVTVVSPSCGLDVLQTAIPEALCKVSGDKAIIDVPDMDARSVIAVGPGIGTEQKVEVMLHSVLKRAESPMVIDADALNILAKSENGLRMVPANSVLTPHPKEFERLFGSQTNGKERLRVLQAKAIEHQVYIVLKGAHSAMATPNGRVYFNSTGNSGMATGGSGDVLTGLIASFIAQTKNVEASVICALYVHGYAADIAADNCGMHGLTPTRIIESIGSAMKTTLEE